MRSVQFSLRGRNFHREDQLNFAKVQETRGLALKSILPEYSILPLGQNLIVMTEPGNRVFSLDSRDYLECIDLYNPATCVSTLA